MTETSDSKLSNFYTLDPDALYGNIGLSGVLDVEPDCVRLLQSGNTYRVILPEALSSIIEAPAGVIYNGEVFRSGENVTVGYSELKVLLGLKSCNYDGVLYITSISLNK